MHLHNGLQCDMLNLFESLYIYIYFFHINSSLSISICHSTWLELSWMIPVVQGNDTAPKPPAKRLVGFSTVAVGGQGCYGDDMWLVWLVLVMNG
jgi:hypothetical protein